MRVVAIVGSLVFLSTVGWALDLCQTGGGGTDCEGYTDVPTLRGFSTEGDPCGFSTDPFNCYGGFEFSRWSLSTSDASPDDCSGPFPEDGTLYLWLVCTSYADYTAGIELAYFSLGGSLRAVSYEALEGTGYLEAEHYRIIQTDLTCPTSYPGTRVVGRLTVEAPISTGDISWGRVRAAYRE